MTTAYHLVCLHCQVHGQSSSSSSSLTFSSSSNTPFLPPPLRASFPPWSNTWVSSSSSSPCTPSTLASARAWIRVYMHVQVPGMACLVFHHHLDQVHAHHVHTHRFHRSVVYYGGWVLVGWPVGVLFMGWLGFMGQDAEGITRPMGASSWGGSSSFPFPMWLWMVVGGGGLLHLGLLVWIQRTWPRGSMHDVLRAHFKLIQSMVPYLHASLNDPWFFNVHQAIQATFKTFWHVKHPETFKLWSVPTSTATTPVPTMETTPLSTTSSSSSTNPSASTPRSTSTSFTPKTFLKQAPSTQGPGRSSSPSLPLRWTDLPMGVMGYVYAHVPEPSRSTIPVPCIQWLLHRFYEHGWYAAIVDLYHHYIQAQDFKYSLSDMTTVMSAMGKVGQFHLAQQVYQRCLDRRSERGGDPLITVFFLNTWVSVLSRNGGAYDEAEKVVRHEFPKHGCVPTLATYLKLIQRAVHLPTTISQFYPFKPNRSSWPMSIDRAWYWYQAFVQAFPDHATLPQGSVPGTTLLKVCNQGRLFQHTLDLFPRLVVKDIDTYVCYAEALASHSNTSLERMLQRLPPHHLPHPQILPWVAYKLKHLAPPPSSSPCSSNPLPRALKVLDHHPLLRSLHPDVQRSLRALLLTDDPLSPSSPSPSSSMATSMSREERGGVVTKSKTETEMKGTVGGPPTTSSTFRHSPLKGSEVQTVGGVSKPSASFWNFRTRSAPLSKTSDPSSNSIHEFFDKVRKMERKGG
ncbi:hypothetical protein HMI55_002305 [Coelomomyces lativittatus]|nr:hypothetical protein HMI55_002305 [Coelomomyces lativittatus]